MLLVRGRIIIRIRIRIRKSAATLGGFKKQPRDDTETWNKNQSFLKVNISRS